MTQAMDVYQETDLKQLYQVAERMLKRAKSLGASQAEVVTSVDAGISVTVRKGDVETIEFNRDNGIGLTVYFGQQKGSASTTDLSNEAVEETVSAACHIAKYTQPDACAGLADADRMAQEIPDLDLYHPWSIDAEYAIELAKNCESAGLNVDTKRLTNSEGATVSSYQSMRVYGNSHGFIAGYPASRQSISCCLIAQEGEGMQRDYYYTVSRNADDMQSAKEVGEEAAARTLQRLKARKVKTQEAPVLFIPETARGLWGHFFSGISGGAIYRKSSFLLDSVGEAIFPSHVQLKEMPHLRKALGSAPFDGEGVATQARDWVKEGVVQSYVLSSYSARKLGLETTGNAGGLHNILVSHGDKTLPELIKSMGKGLIVTELMGQGVNKVTGDYSRGATGLWVENGAIQHPVEEVTIAGNLKNMFKGVREIGADVDTRGNIQTGSVLVDTMMIAGD